MLQKATVLVLLVFFYSLHLSGQCSYSASVTAPTNIICEGETTFLNFSINGGTPPYTVVYQLNGLNMTANFQSAAGNAIPISPVITVNYGLSSVIDATGCAADVFGGGTIVVQPIPNAFATSISACDQGNGEAVFDLTTLENTITGGTGQNVGWFYNAAASIPIVSPQSLVNTSAVVYATVQEGNCVSAPALVELTVIDGIAPPEITGMLTLCPGYINNLFAEDGYATYQWNTGATSSNISVNTPGTYSVTVTNAAGCAASSSVVVTEGSINPPIIDGPAYLCEDEQGTLFTIGNYTDYFWANGQIGPVITVVGPGLYEVTVVDFNGCSASTIYAIEPMLDIYCAQSQPDTGLLPFNGMAEVALANGTPPYTVSWIGASQGNMTIDSSDPFVISGLAEGLYALEVEDATGCTGTCEFEILGDEDYNFTCNLAETLPLNLPTSCNQPAFNSFLLNNLNPTDNSALPAFSGCDGDGQTDPSVASVWYSFVGNGDAVEIVINQGLNTPNAVLYKGNCDHLIPIACASATPGAGSVALTADINPGRLYYLQIAGGDAQDQNQFFLGITVFNNCPDVCSVTGTLTADPPPVNGQYQQGQSVQFCYAISELNLVDDVAWFHGLEVHLGPAWNLSTFVPAPSPTCGNSPGFWGWYESWVSCITGMSFGPGFAFESTGSSCGGGFDNDPGNNYGNGENGCSNSQNLPFNFCWTVEVSECLLPSDTGNLNVQLLATTDGLSGGWNSFGCTIPIDYFFTADRSTSIMSVNLGPDVEACLGDTHLIDATVENCPDCTYSWSTGETTPSIIVAQSGSYNVTVTAPDGCTGEDEIMVTFHPPSETNITATICDGDSYFVGGQVFNQTGFYQIVLASQVTGCDSLILLDLEVIPTAFTNLTVQICEGESYSVGSSVYTTTGQYTEVLTTSFGCDSIVELSLTVFPAYEESLSVTICEDESYNFNGEILTETGIYEQNQTTTVGCDSTTILNLTVLDIPVTIIDTTILQGDSITVAGNTYSEEGIYRDTIPGGAANGCDSIIVTDLSILITECNSAGTTYFAPFTGQSNDTSPDTIFLCFGDTLRVRHNGDFDLSGDPNTVTPSGIGYAFYDCPPSITGPTLDTILSDPCLNRTSPLIVNGQPVAQEDSIWITTGPVPTGDLDFVNTGTLQEAFNNGEAIPTLFWLAPITLDDFAERFFEEDGSGNVGPCVSVSTVEAFSVVLLNEMAITNLEANPNGCGASFKISGGLPEWDDSTYDVSITKTDDPEVVGTLVTTTVGHDETATITVPQPGIYDILVEDGKSCPAMASIDLNFHEVAINITNEITCHGDSDGALEIIVTLDGEVISDLTGYEIAWSGGLDQPQISDLPAGDYSVTVTNPLGCQAIAEASLLEPDLFETTINVSICEGDSYTLGASTYDMPGTYTETFTNSNGCDSLVTVILEVLPNPTATITASSTLICAGEATTLTGSGGLVYEWSNGATTSQITVSPLVTTAYSLTVTDENGCTGETAITISVEEPLPPLIVSCTTGSPDEISFNWNDLDGIDSYEVSYLNQTQVVTLPSFIVTGLTPNEVVTLEVRPVYAGPCPVESTTLTCLSNPCPELIIDVEDLTLCVNDPPTQLTANLIAGSGAGFFSWQGSGIVAIDGLFDPAAAGIGQHVITVTYVEGLCEVQETMIITVVESPVAAFNLENQICIDGFGTITFQGNAGLDATFNWDFDGGTATPGTGPGPHEVSWPIGGLKTVSLTIEENGCVSETFSRDIEVAPPLMPPNVSCVGFADQLAFGWPPVPGATGYEVNILSGQSGLRNGNLLIVSGLMDGEEVTVEVIAINAGSACFDQADTLTCQVESSPIIMLSEPTFELDEATGTVQVVLDDAAGSFHIRGPYPNPTQDQSWIELDLETQQAVEMTLVDVNGRVLEIRTDQWLSKGVHLLPIDTHQLPPGIYLLKVKIGDQVKTKKLAVVR